MTLEERNKQLVLDIMNALTRGDVDAVVKAYADDAEVWTSGNTLISGTRTGGHREAIAGIMDVFPEGLSFTVTGMTAEGERVAVEAESCGKHVSGQIYSNKYHFLFVFRDGKLVQLKEYMDTEPVTDILCGGQRPG